MTKTSDVEVSAAPDALGDASRDLGPALPHSFYDRETTEVARDLLGRILIHETPAGTLAGTIVETEAYGPDDPANHAARGPSPRNRVMFGPPGYAYVYRIYGLYWCVNAVTRGEGLGEAVLIRALEPVRGIEAMKQNRGTTDIKSLCSGPGRLCAALGITGALNGADLTSSSLRIAGASLADPKIVATTRVGLTQAADRPWRYYLAGNPYLSRK